MVVIIEDKFFSIHRKPSVILQNAHGKIFTILFFQFLVHTRCTNTCYPEKTHNNLKWQSSKASNSNKTLQQFSERLWENILNISPKKVKYSFFILIINYFSNKVLSMKVIPCSTLCYIKILSLSTEKVFLFQKRSYTQKLKNYCYRSKTKTKILPSVLQKHDIKTKKIIGK